MQWRTAVLMVAAAVLPETMGQTLPPTTPATATCPSMVLNWDYFGNDIGFFSGVTSPPACCTLCGGNLNCTHWTYIGGRCWLKDSSGNGGRFSSRGHFSGSRPSGTVPPTFAPTVPPTSAGTARCGPMTYNWDCAFLSLVVTLCTLLSLRSPQCPSDSGFGLRLASATHHRVSVKRQG
eukprot:m.189613 g.189613  ORF g.189613 m.189613 type:complete len:178 (+) comp15112_c0_seq3:64-597(+)